MIESIQIFAVMIGILVQVLIINWWTIFPMFIMGFFYWQIRNIFLKTAQDMKRFEGASKSFVIYSFLEILPFRATLVTVT